MRSRLYPNIKRLTTMFCVGIFCMTISVLALRLTVFSEMAVVPAGYIPGTEFQGEQDGSSFLYRLNPNIYFSSPGGKGNYLIENPRTNDYYLQVIIETDEGDLVYDTKHLYPGAIINSARLQCTLEQGVYQCTATIIALDNDSREEVGREELPVTVYIGIKPN